MFKRNRFFSLILSIMLVLSFFPSVAYAEGNNDGAENKDEQSIQIQRIMANQIEDDLAAQIRLAKRKENTTEDSEKGEEGFVLKKTGTQKADAVIEISTPEDLNNVRDGLYGDYILVNDIDLTSYTSSGGAFYNRGKGWEPIGTSDTAFAGTFDGNGYTISGLYSNGYTDTALFGYNEGVIMNLCVSGSIVGSPEYQGSAAGIVSFNSSSGVIRNCKNKASVTFSAEGNYCSCAGIAAYNYGEVSKCENLGTIKAVSTASTGDTAVNAGGLVAMLGGTVSGKNSGSISCTVNAREQAAYAGGIAAFVSTGGSVSNSVNSGSVYAKSYKGSTQCGGIAGAAVERIEGCSNSGKISADNDNADNSVNCGGIAGTFVFFDDSDVSSEITDSSNSGTINAKGKAKVNTGGIAGSLSNEDSFAENCSNSGSVTGSVYYDDFDNEAVVGGIAGYSEGVVYRSYNTGSINSNGFYFNYGSSGGIVGTQYEGAITQCYNRGTINGFLRSGGICASNYGTITNSYNVGTIKGSGEADYMGGIVGGNFTGGKVGFVYNVGLIIGSSSEFNGIIGYNGDICTDNVYNLSWQGYAVDDHSIGSRCSYIDMKSMYTYDDFDFDSIWTMGTGLYKLPILKSCVDADRQANNKINIAKAPFKLGYTSTPYSGSAKKPAVSLSGLRAGTDFTTAYTNNTKIGTAIVTVTGAGAFTGTKTLTFSIVKKANTLKATAKPVTLKESKLKKKDQTVKRSKAITIKKPVGTVTYKLSSVSKSKFKKYFKVNKKTGNITVKKGLEKGTYKVKIKVKAAGNSTTKSLTKTVTIKVKVV